VRTALVGREEEVTSNVRIYATAAAETPGSPELVRHFTALPDALGWLEKTSLAGEVSSLIEAAEAAAAPAEQLADRLGAALRETVTRFQGRELRVTASFGITTYNAGRDGLSTEAMVVHADDALYAAKAAGRDSARVAG
jgi:GGDEF domain-containing protein